MSSRVPLLPKGKGKKSKRLPIAPRAKPSQSKARPVARSEASTNAATTAEEFATAAQSRDASLVWDAPLDTFATPTKSPPSTQNTEQTESSTPQTNTAPTQAAPTPSPIKTPSKARSTPSNLQVTPTTQPSKTFTPIQVDDDSEDVPESPDYPSVPPSQRASSTSKQRDTEQSPFQTPKRRNEETETDSHKKQKQDKPKARPRLATLSSKSKTDKRSRATPKKKSKRKEIVPVEEPVPVRERARLYAQSLWTNPPVPRVRRAKKESEAVAEETELPDDLPIMSMRQLALSIPRRRTRERTEEENGEEVEVPEFGNDAPSADGNTVLQPSVQIINGQMVITQKSVQVEAEEEEVKKVEKPVQSRRRWTKEETKQFYYCLSQVGMDFGMLATLFPDRARTELKRKFKAEERKNRRLIEMALSVSSAPMDTEMMDTMEMMVDKEAEERNKSKEEEEAEEEVTEEVAESGTNEKAKEDVEMEPPFDPNEEVEDAETYFGDRDTSMDFEY